MRRVILSLFLSLLMAVPLAGANWSALADRVAKATVYVEIDGTGGCTGFVINEEKNYVLTAAHCFGKEVLVDQLTSKMLSKDEKSDLMVLEVKDLDKPQIEVARQDPKRGDEVMSFGYGYGLERPMLRVTHISDHEAEIPELPGKWILTDATFVGGMSGGPVVNEKAEVVMMVQRGTNSVGLGKGAELIRSKVGRFLGRVAKP